jgi:hypothetical protein
MLLLIEAHHFEDGIKSVSLTIHRLHRAILTRLPHLLGRDLVNQRLMGPFLRSGPAGKNSCKLQLVPAG